MKVKLINCQLLQQTHQGECLLTLETVRGWIWKDIQKFQVRGSLRSGNWYYYPSGVECVGLLWNKLNTLVRRVGKEHERRERVEGWKNECRS
jgi:hypothetical protein